MFLLVPAYPGSPGQKAVKRLCVCVCVCVYLDADRTPCLTSDAIRFATLQVLAAAGVAAAPWRLAHRAGRIASCVARTDGRPSAPDRAPHRCPWLNDVPTSHSAASLNQCKTTMGNIEFNQQYGLLKCLK